MDSEGKGAEEATRYCDFLFSTDLKFLQVKEDTVLGGKHINNDRQSIVYAL